MALLGKGTGSLLALGLLVIAVAAAFLEITWAPMLLVILGLVVGYLNITEGETVKFLIASLVIVGVSGILALLPAIGGMLESIFQNVALAAGATALLPAIKVWWKAAKRK